MTYFENQMHWLICCIKNSKTLGIVVPEGKKIWYFASASFPCKGLVCHIFDMRIPWFWKRIWHGSISGNICLIEVSNPAKFDAFIKKRTILSLNSWTTGFWMRFASSVSGPGNIFCRRSGVSRKRLGPT